MGRRRSESSSLTNLLVTSEPQIKVHRYGQAAYLGHSSTLSFSRNVRNLLQQSSPIADPESVSMERQDISYTRTLPPIGLDLSSIALPELSYAEYLTNTVIVHIAFGKSIQSREHSEMGTSGMAYFTLAIEAMPDIRRLYEHPLLSIESQNAFSIHAILSFHLGKTLDAIYGVHDQQRNFLLEVKSILSRIAETYVVLRQHLPLDVQQPSQPISRESATLHLLLHQCVILTVRLVLFSLLKPLLAPNAPVPHSRHSSSPFESMLKICIDSAVQILKIMSILKQQMMCDIFLPYDIDALFSSAFALILIDLIRPANELLWDLPQVMNLLDEFVERRVAPAQAYRSDLVQILELHTKLRWNSSR
ncbi:hypothetical protein FGADI_323 [Fusarium gaditjirri]|uniref:Uncharacterized protein n=1 Tax=Fusarium gaditjirri TaxID=282569 RepID=A0A8H4TNU2_9HYPO|nr:hypothetical protein FGADI_323 [Fusarium gaditjirri]